MRRPKHASCGARPWRPWIPVLTLALAAAAPVVAADETQVTIWQWTDAAGITRYTPDYERIPGSARDTAVAMQPGAPPPPTTPVYFEPDPRAAVAVPSQPAPGSPASAGHAESAPAIRGSATPAGGAPPAGDLDARIRELETRIAADEEALKQRISAPDAAADVEVSPELREIAARLPQLQAQLESLRAQRDGSGAP